ncbi:19116_t:CDS:10 [Entrophospora sp. SA101]|nr:19110_t:CDS:10 [Entrophospora sp. SA101]CAJ0868066.1 19116_t:CDS:10 [Entrophospora sp. SA101]
MEDKGVFKRLVEVGRVVFINHGKDSGKLAVIVDIIDHNRALIDGPITGVARHVHPYRRLVLTDFVIKCFPRGGGSTVVKKHFEKEKILEKWNKTSWAKKLDSRDRRAKLSDFDRHKLLKLKKQSQENITTEEQATENSEETNSNTRIEYDYEAREDDELSLEKGGIITVIEQGEGGWWKGDLNGKTGIFPENHVKLIEVTDQSNDVNDGEQSEGKGKFTKKLAIYGVKQGGIGSLFSGGIPTLGKKKRSQQPSDSSAESNDNNEGKQLHETTPVPSKKTITRRTTSSDDSDSHPKIGNLPSPPKPEEIVTKPASSLPPLPKKLPPKPKKSELKAKVLYDYDIALVAGTTITILDKTDDGWWRGKNDQGEVGLFPSTSTQPKSVAETTSDEQQASSVSSKSKRPASLHSQSSDVPNSKQAWSYEDSPTLPKSPPPPITASTTTKKNSIHESPSPTSTSTVPSPITSPPGKPKSPSSPVTRKPSKVTPKEKKVNDDNNNVAIVQGTKLSSSPPLSASDIITDYENSSDNEIATSPIERHPIAPPRVPSRPTSQIDVKSDTNKFAPAKPPSVPVKKTSTSSSSSSSSTRSAIKSREVGSPLQEISNQELKEEVVLVEKEVKKPLAVPPITKLSSLGKDRPAIRGRRIPTNKSSKDSSGPSQNALLEEALASEKNEEESKPSPPPLPYKPERPVKPNMFKLPIAGAGLPAVQLRQTPRRPVEPPIESSLKKLFNEEIAKLKNDFETKLAQERIKREELEEKIQELLYKLEG